MCLYVSCPETKPSIYMDLATNSILTVLKSYVNMCTSNSKQCMSPPSLKFLNQKPKSKFRIRAQVRIHRLNRANKFMEEKMKHEMELKNLKLYMENMNILKENERLRNKATVLHQENLALLSVLEKKNVKL